MGRISAVGFNRAAAFPRISSARLMTAVQPLESKRCFMLRAARSKLSTSLFWARTNNTPSSADTCLVSGSPVDLPDPTGFTATKSNCRRSTLLVGRSRSSDLAMASLLRFQSEVLPMSQRTVVSGCPYRIFRKIRWPEGRITLVSSRSGQEIRLAMTLWHNLFPQDLKL